MRDMKKFLQIVKQAAVEAYEARKPCNVMFAKVESVSPVYIKLEGQLIIPDELLVFTGDTKQNLKENDRLAVIRKQGGQKYLVIGVIV